MTPVDPPHDEPTAAPVAEGQASASEPDIDRLRNEVDRLRGIVERQELLIGQLTQGLKDLKQLKWGRRSEKLTTAQLALASRRSP